MEDPAKIVVFGDPLSREWSPELGDSLRRRFPEKKIDVIHAGNGAETSTDGIAKLDDVARRDSNIVILSYGAGDIRSGTVPSEFKVNIKRMILALRKKNRVILMTLPPIHKSLSGDFSQFSKSGLRRIRNEYNNILIELTRKYRLRIVMVHTLWKRELKPQKKGLRNDGSPNKLGKELILKALMRVVPREHLTIVWQFNDRFGLCNYGCEYCYRPTSTQKEIVDIGDIQEWGSAFKKCFGDEKIVFYLCNGEPVISKKFFDVIEMINGEPRWKVVITSNMSNFSAYKKLMEYPLVKEGRLEIHASFHPTQTDIDKFIEKIEFLRGYGLEIPVVFVMWPPLIKDFENIYFKKFMDHNIYVHVRRFQGMHKYKKYPQAYTTEEWCAIAKYQNRADLQYNMIQRFGFGRESYIGMYHILVNREGDVELCDSYYGSGQYGNVFNGWVGLDLEPKPFAGPIPLSSVDDITSYLETDFNQLEGNPVLHYAFQGDVTRDSDGRYVYPYLNTDFKDKKTRIRLCQAPVPWKQRLAMIMNPLWHYEEFFHGVLVQKALRELNGIFKGKIWLLGRDQLRFRNFWHS